MSSQSQLVDGKTGDPIGYNIYQGQAVGTTTSNYIQQGYSTYGTGSGAGYTSEYKLQGGVPTTTEYRVGSGTGEYRVGGGAVTTTTTNVVGTTVNTGKDVIKGESRIEYVPFQKKIIEYKDQAKVERVPKKVKKVEYREERKVENIPKEVTVTDYYAVEYLRQYIPQYVPEKRVEYVQVPKKTVRYEYIPVERQIVHYPDQAIEGRETRVEGGQQVYYTSGQQQGYTVEGAREVSYTTGPTQQVTYTTTTQPVGYTTTTTTQPAGYTTATTGERVVYSTGGQTYQVPGTTTTTYDANQKYYSTGYQPGNSTYDYTQVATNYAVQK